VFVMNFYKKAGLMQEDTINILYQKTEDVCSKKTIYTLMVLPNRKNKNTRYQARRVQVAVEAWR